MDYTITKIEVLITGPSERYIDRVFYCFDKTNKTITIKYPQKSLDLAYKLIDCIISDQAFDLHQILVNNTKLSNREQLKELMISKCIEDNLIIIESENSLSILYEMGCIHYKNFNDNDDTVVGKILEEWRLI